MNNQITLYQVSSLEKVYLDYQGPEKEIDKLSLLKNERISYQVAYQANTFQFRSDMKVTIDSPLKAYISVRQVGNVPSQYPVRPPYDEHYERYAPGLFPDVLYPLENDTIEVLNGTWHSLWITLELDGTVSAGNYPITLCLSGDGITVQREMSVEILDALLPPQDMVFTQWLHVDCLANYYKLPVYSEQHWLRIEQFVKTAVKYGINMMLVPIITPPLDTEVGRERTNVQLLDITKNGDHYEFGFEKLRRFIRLCLRNGIQYFEISHLFTQWGLKFTPNIYATEDGCYQRIFGWDVKAEDERYMNFLTQLLPRLDAVLVEEGVSKNTFFHISDEPYADHIERYKVLREKLTALLPNYTFIDALSVYDFYKQGVVDKPIPATNHIEPFIEAKAPDLWCYYCCSQSLDVSNRFMSLPSYRNRIIGLQFYKFDIKGFLHWGFNFYNSALSKKQIDPFRVTDAIDTYQSGDPFSVYPGEDGPIESMRLLIFYDALQDLRALKLLESYWGKEKVVAMIEEEAGMEIRFNQYPLSMEFMLRIREKINREIEKAISK